MNGPVICRWICSSTLVLGTAALAISPAAVQQKLNAGEKVTFVDVRATAAFQRSHIPGAINIPGALAPLKQLPPLGHVVVYDEGLGRGTAEAAVAALNQKPGINAEVLDGGLGAWETAHALTTKPAGMTPEELPLITYDQLKQAPGTDVVLVDLRQGEPTSSVKKAAQAVRAPLTDLRAEFPNVRVTRSPFTEPAGRKAASTGSVTPPPLLVLIDNEDGAAQATARALKANGVTRFAILAGGEGILARKGQRGLQRLGSTITVQKPVSPMVTNTNR